MKLWKRLTAALFLLTLIGLPASSTPQADSISVIGRTARVLKGLQGVRVLLETINRDAIEDGLREETIQTDVELKLRLAGIHVLTPQECEVMSGHPTLYVSIDTLKPKEGAYYSFNVEAELIESVSLERNPKITVLGATTWSRNITGIVSQSILPKIRDSIKDLTDQFCNDYLTVNPKK